MTLSSKTVLISGVAGFAALFSSASLAMAAEKVTFNGNTYYVVNGNDPKMDSGNEVCASVGMKFAGYKSINTTGVCKARHPTAKEVTSVNGSKAGFYCNGAPQTGLACGKMKNVCQVCPACNLNEAADGNQTIGGHFAEMYVFCEGGMSKSSLYGALPLPKFQSDPNNCGAAGKKCLTGMICSNGACARKAVASSSSVDSRIGKQTGYKVCEYYQATKPSDPVRATKKLVSCGVPGLADKFCKTSLNNPAAKSLKCEENGIVVCGLPCTTPGARNEWFCSADINRPRGTMVKPLDFCPPLPSTSSAKPTKDPGQLCQHGGECKSGMCLGVVPGREYRCSCIGSQSKWQGCTTTNSSPLPATNRAPGVTCQHGGQCQSGMCLGVVPGQQYVCSCNDPKTQWSGCRK
ncbi:MAG: hypothetical protein HOO67_02025 [Candidatus Peribacteraceae bacterium]|nr:hypothetical protein [Candidatus Peribacteraceae bacterium]